jgi:hypothetical protein
MKSCLFCGKSLNSSSKTYTKIYNTSFPHSHHKSTFFHCSTRCQENVIDDSPNCTMK